MGDEELVKEIALGPHDLDPVIPCLAGAGGGGDDIGDLLFDPLFVELLRREGRDGGFDGRGRNTLRPIGIAARVEDLHTDLATGIVDAIRHDPVVGDVVIGEEPSGAREHAALAIGRHAARHHQPNAAPRPRGVELGHAVPILGFFEVRVHRAHQHAILQRGEAKVERGE